MLGAKLRLHDTDDGRLAPIRERRGIEVEGQRCSAVERSTGWRKRSAAPKPSVIVSGGNAQADGALLAPLLRDGQIILLIQGNTGGSLVVRRALDAAGCRAQVDIAEMDNYPYSSWRLGAVRIRPIVRKRWLQIATFPGNRIGPRPSPVRFRWVSARRCRARHHLDRLHQRQRDAACRQLRRQRR